MEKMKNLKDWIILNIQKCMVVAAVLATLAVVFAVKPFATDGYVEITSKADLESYIASQVGEHRSTVMIDYSGEDYANLKSWLKNCFAYNTLINYIDDYSAYNYVSTSYTYWTYSNKKRVKMELSYIMTNEQIATVDAWANEYISQNGLASMTQYEAVKNIHDYIKANFTYQLGANNVAECITNKTANCYGVAMLDYLVLNKLNIPTRITTGTMGGSHCWNVTQLNGQWYYTDIIWDMSDTANSNFLVSTSVIKKSKTITGGFIPDCPSNYVTTDADFSTSKVEEAVPEVAEVETVESETETQTETAVNDGVVDSEEVKDTSEAGPIIVEPANEVTSSNHEVVVVDNNDTKEDASLENSGDTSSVADSDTSTSQSTTSSTSEGTQSNQKLSKLLKTLKALKKAKK
jgi:hypothetical protein